MSLPSSSNPDTSMHSTFALSHFPFIRPRRLRQNRALRAMARETVLTPSNLILPVFLLDGNQKVQNITSMPGVQRMSVDQLLTVAEDCCNLGIPAMALFPVIETHLKTATGSEALNPKGLVPTALQIIKKQFPQLALIADVALDPYTSHGQDGLIDSTGYVLNDETVEVLTQQATVYADAGADIIAPSDMMDGRVGKIRLALENNKFFNTCIMAYSAKYASAFYGPFRDAVGSAQQLGKADKTTYQIDPANQNEALREVAMDIAEGADMVMVKPGMPYLDVIERIKTTFGLPTFAYQVSGEYTMIKAAAQLGWLNQNAIMMESLMAFRRAGADGILSYFARDAARLLKTA